LGSSRSVCGCRAVVGIRREWRTCGACPTYLTDFVARDNSPGSVRSYAYALLRWWRWLLAVRVERDRATPTEARDLVLWLKQATKPRNSARTVSAATAGTVTR
jgi:integrase/recombinase XerD